MLKITVIGIVSSTALTLAIILYPYQKNQSVPNAINPIHISNYKQPKISTEQGNSTTYNTTAFKITSNKNYDHSNNSHDSALHLAELTDCSPKDKTSHNMAKDNDEYIQSINDTLNSDSKPDTPDNELVIQRMGCAGVIAFYEFNNQFYGKDDFAYLIERTTDQQERVKILKDLFYLGNTDSVALSIEVLKDLGVLPDEHELYADLITYAEADYNLNATRDIVYLLPIDDPQFRKTHRDTLDALFLTLELHTDPEVRAKAASNQFWLSMYDNDQANAFYFLNEKLSDTSGEVRYALYDDLQKVLNNGESGIPEESLVQLSELLQSEHLNLKQSETQIVKGLIKSAQFKKQRR